MDSKKDEENDWFDVVDFPLDQVPFLNELVDQMTLIDTPPIDENDWSKKLGKISLDLEKILNHPRQIRLKKPVKRPVAKGGEKDTLPVHSGPFDLDKVPESKLVGPLKDLEELVLNNEGGILEDPEFIGNFFDLTNLFNDMIEPNSEENNPDSYIFDANKFQDFQAKLNELKKINEPYNNKAIDEVINDIKDIDSFQSGDGTVIEPLELAKTPSSIEKTKSLEKPASDSSEEIDPGRGSDQERDTKPLLKGDPHNPNPHEPKPKSRESEPSHQGQAKTKDYEEEVPTHNDLSESPSGSSEEGPRKNIKEGPPHFKDQGT